MKLMKYELMRRKNILIGGAISMLFVEGVALFGMLMGGSNWRAGWNGWNMLAAGMTMLLVFGGFILAFLDGVIRLYSDYKQKHGYMIFMTPQNGYKVIWAKTIFAALEIIVAGIIIIGCLAVSAVVLDNIYVGEISNFLAMLKVYNISAGTIIGGGVVGLLQIMAQLSIAILAVTVSRAMMPSKSYNWLVTLLMYFALAIVVNVVDGGLLFVFGVAGDMALTDNGAGLIESGLLAKYLWIGVGTYVTWFTGCTLLSGRMVNRGIDL